MTVRDYGTTAGPVHIRSATTRVSGQIDVLFVPDIPADERWLWDNPAAMRMAVQGMEEARRVQTRDLGSFARYADLEIDD